MCCPYPGLPSKNNPHFTDLETHSSGFSTADSASAATDPTIATSPDLRAADAAVEPGTAASRTHLAQLLARADAAMCWLALEIRDAFDDSYSLPPSPSSSEWDAREDAAAAAAEFIVFEERKSADGSGARAWEKVVGSPPPYGEDGDADISYVGLEMCYGLAKDVMGSAWLDLPLAGVIHDLARENFEVPLKEFGDDDDDDDDDDGEHTYELEVGDLPLQYLCTRVW